MSSTQVEVLCTSAWCLFRVRLIVSIDLIMGEVKRSIEISLAHFIIWLIISSPSQIRHRTSSLLWGIYWSLWNLKRKPQTFMALEWQPMFVLSVLQYMLDWSLSMSMCLSTTSIRAMLALCVMMTQRDDKYTGGIFNQHGRPSLWGLTGWLHPNKQCLGKKNNSTL